MKRRVEVRTRRLLLRRWSPEDVAPLAEVLLDPAVSGWLGYESHEDVERAIERYEHSWETLGYGRFAVIDRASGLLVGRVGVMRQEGWRATVEKDEIGWAIHASRQREGLATEAARAAIDDALSRVGLGRIISYTVPSNAASLRVMEKCGLVFGGHAEWAGRDHVWYDVRSEA